MADYLILMDESGQPYLAHAWGTKKDHKYVHKEPNYYGPGKHLYLYSQKEYERWLKRDKKRNVFQRVKDRARDVLGWDERAEKEAAKENQDSARAAYGSANRRSEQIETQQRGNQKLAVDASVKQENAAYNYRQATRDYQVAQEAYDKTFLGTVDRIKNYGKKSLSEVREYNGKPISMQQVAANYNVQKDRIKTQNRRNLRESKPWLLNMLDALMPVDKTTTDTTTPTVSKPQETVPETPSKTYHTYRERRVNEINDRLSAIRYHDLPPAKAEYSRALKELGVANKNHGSDSVEAQRAREKVEKRRTAVEALEQETTRLKNEKDLLNQQ